MTDRCHLFRCAILKKGSVTIKKEVLVFVFDGYADLESAYKIRDSFKEADGYKMEVGEILKLKREKIY